MSLLEYLKLKRVIMRNTSKDRKQLVKLYNPFGKQYGASLKATFTCNIWPSYFTLVYLFKKNKSKCPHNFVNESL